MITWPTRATRALLPALLTALAVATTHVALADEEQHGSGLSPVLPDGALAEIETARSADDAAKERRKTPSARADRVRSRDAYRGLGRAAALALAKEKFGGIFRAPAFEPYSPPPGLRIKEFFGSDGALLAGDTPEANQLVESHGYPFSSTIGSGEREVIDLRLAEDARAFVPRNPAVRTRIGKAGQAKVGAVAIGVAGVDRADQPVDSNGRVFFGNALVDTDMSIKPVPLGVELAFQVRSAAAPERAILDVTAPGNLVLEESSSDAGEVVKVFVDGELAGRIAPPAAWDADGERFPVSYEVVGDRLQVRFPHRDRDLHYPLYVDPVYEQWGQWYGQAWDQWDQEQGGYNGGSGFYFSSNGDQTNWIRNHTGKWFNSWDYGRRLWMNPRGYISELGFLYVNHTPQATCLSTGLINYNRTAWKTSWTECGSFSGAYPSHTNGDVQYMDHAALQLHMNGHGGRWYTATAEASGVNLGRSDADVPVLTSGSHSRDWFDDGAQPVTYPVSAQDLNQYGQHGTGIKRYDVTEGGALKARTETGCTGIRTSWCPIDSSGSARNVSWTLHEGVNSVRVTAYDALDKASAYQTWTFKVDRTNPSLNYNGSSVWGSRCNLDAAGKCTPLTGSSYSFNVTGNDAGAGIRSIEIKVDGVRKAYQEWSCGGGSCSQTLPWTFYPRNYPSGDRWITVTTTDHFGRSKSDTWVVNTQFP